MRTRLFLVLAMIVGLIAVPANAATRSDADYKEYYFTSSDGVTRLHADVLRPKGMPDSEKTPVILTVSPYTSHAGQTGPEVAALTDTGPSPRFYDFLDLSQALGRGYTYVMVDLPGDGGSAGCNDWGGAREQAAVRAAVEWAADQAWSTGKVALLGKSYDGWTGLMGIAQQPRGLAAVVSLEPVYSGYRYIWMNGVRRQGTWPYGTNFTTVDAMPGRPTEPEYTANGAPEAWCYPVNIAGETIDDSENGPYWAERDLIPTAFGKDTPLFLTQGFLERNTRQDGAFDYFNSLSGDQNRAWFGQFDHCRAWETQQKCGGAGGSGDNTRLAVGRAGFVDEVMAFLDLHLKGNQPAVPDPTVEVQDALGRWRAEEAWPPKDAKGFVTHLRSGTYDDTGSGSGLTPTATQGLWSISAPLDHEVWLAGTPRVTVSVDAVPNSNMAANVYDVDADGNVRMISRGAQSLSGTGVRNFTFTLYGQDWPIPAGHRIGVLLSSANTEEFRHVATRAPVTVRNAKIRLPFLKYERTEFLDGAATGRLEQYLSGSATTLTAEQIAGVEIPFELPAPLEARTTTAPAPE